ncbi:D-arabinono-1,4-lactone oxidase [Sphaerisporangium sp. NPDC051017]|uniref:D-arabinono-1,4-lactone oxidase n=1 Tax=Sphaerisporangium sp. NPDC051017 TaxID=3154636 RepID=UPI00343BB7FD
MSSQITNWAGNVVFRAERVERPSSLDELRALVARSGKVRVLGSGHSFTRIADTPGVLVSLDGLPVGIEIDGDGAGVRVTGSVRYTELGPRPHWGKLFTIPAGTLRTRYERLPDFRKPARDLDPAGKFANEFVDEYVLSE